jgi:bifunctional non-homologous end joining protein LigD
MTPVPAAWPLDSVDYAYEIRWEGVRFLAGFESSQLSSYAAQVPSLQALFPELGLLRAALRPDWVLVEGELVAMVDDRPAPLLLQQRLRARSSAEVEALSSTCPATIVLTDILRIGDGWLLDVAWEERREILGRAIHPTSGVRLSPAYRQGAFALELARGLGLEAVIARRLRGRYSPGERSRDLLSVKPLDQTHAVIVGWRTGRATPDLRSLVLGVWRGERLHYAGHTVKPIPADVARRLFQRLIPLERATCPLGEPAVLPTQPHWVDPELVCLVGHTGWTAAGRLRTPEFLELVEGLEPAECKMPVRASVGLRRRA